MADELAPQELTDSAVNAPAAALAADHEPQPKQRRHTINNIVRTALLMLLALGIGVGLGIVIYPRIPVPGTPQVRVTRTSVAEGDLDAPMGSYTYGGTTVTVSIREAIEESSSLEAAKNSNGSYQVPSADAVLGVARNAILLEDAEDRGISATEDDARAYMQETLDTDDLAVVAANYGMTPEQTLKRLQSAATLKKLRDEVVESELPVEPVAPEAPEGDKENEPTQAYADYVIALAGDEWDSENNTWAEDGGPYRERLRDYTISNEGATYTAAQEAYSLAMERYASAQQQISSEWTAYVNDKLSHVTVELGTLVA